MKSNIIFVLRDINHWGVKNVLRTIVHNYNIHLLIYNNCEDLQSYCVQYGVQYTQIRRTQFTSKLENVLESLVKVDNKEEFERNVFLNENRFQGTRTKKNKVGRIGLIPVNWMYFILSRIKSDYDDLLSSENEKVVYISRFLPSLHLPLRFNHLGAKVFHWNYSWDHPFRSKFIPPFFYRYFVWNEHLAVELFKIHKVQTERIRIIGSTIVDYLVDNTLISTNKDESLPEFSGLKKYFLYLFGTGYQPALSQEIKLVKLLAEILWNLDKEVMIVARPYPDSVDGLDAYSILEDQPNVKIQKNIQIGTNVQTDEDMLLKRNLLMNCSGVFNLYTTMAMEAAVLGKPIVQLAFFPEELKGTKNENGIDIAFLMSGTHLLKYLYRDEYINVVHSISELENVISRIIGNDIKNLIAYSNYLADFCVPDKHKPAVEQLIEALE